MELGPWSNLSDSAGLTMWVTVCKLPLLEKAHSCRSSSHFTYIHYSDPHNSFFILSFHLLSVVPSFNPYLLSLFNCVVLKLLKGSHKPTRYDNETYQTHKNTKVWVVSCILSRVVNHYLLFWNCIQLHVQCRENVIFFLWSTRWWFVLNIKCH
jgi:hypothetical protein